MKPGRGHSTMRLGVRQTIDDTSPQQGSIEVVPEKQITIQRAGSTTFLLVVAAFLFILSISIRLIGIKNDSPQPDEQHWLIRSSKSLNNLKSGNVSTFNVHLGHPGVPASAIFTFTEWLRESYVLRSTVFAERLGSLDPLTASRIANVIVSSIIFPLFFLCACQLVGFKVSLLTTLLFLFNPSHIGLSRLVHLDATLTLFITLAILLYALSEQHQRTSLKLLAGVFWGLGVATKPTAGFLIPGILLYRVGAKFILRKSQAYPLLTWGDLWAVLIGHAVFALTYTRLWQENSRYVYKFKIHNQLTNFLLNTGPMLGQSWMLLGSLACLIALLLVVLLKNKNSFRPRVFHLGMAMLVLSTFTVAWASVPVVLANIIRFWIWAIGLNRMVHRSYGRVWEPPDYGYLSLILTKLPSFVLVGATIGILVLISRLIFRERSLTEPPANRTPSNPANLSLYLLGIATLVTWIILLSSSSKQTFRYLMPLVPMLYLVAAYGWVTLFQRLSHSRFAFHFKLHPQKTFIALSSFLVLSQGVIYWSWKPHFSLFFNAISGGLAAEVASGRPLPVAGINQTLQYLQDQAEERNHQLWVMLLGDVDITLYSYRRLFPNNHNLLNFIAYKPTTSSDYLLVFPGFQHKIQKFLNSEATSLTLAYNYSFRAVPLMSLYNLPFPDYKTPKEIDILKGGRNTGKGVFFGPKKVRGALAKVGSHRADYLAFGLTLRLPAGNYLVHLPAALAKPVTKIPPDRNVFRFELGQCSQNISFGQLRKRINLIPIHCQFSIDRIQQLRVYWYGEQSVFLGNPTIESYAR